MYGEVCKITYGENKGEEIKPKEFVQSKGNFLSFNVIVLVIFYLVNDTNIIKQIST